MGIPFLIFLAVVRVIVASVIVSYLRLDSLTPRSLSSRSDLDVLELDCPDERQAPKVSVRS